jgi:outer membrane protein OmpA-like peptidoglycan-associated protein
MFNRRHQVHADEGERPFWISYADMMTASMTLFLVMMAAFIAVNTKNLNNYSEDQKKAQERQTKINEVMAKIAEKLKKDPVAEQYQVVVNTKSEPPSIDMGGICEFKQSDYSLSADQLTKLRKVVKNDVVDVISEVDSATQWVKSVDVVGFASSEGSYLTNLGISQARSAFMVCSLLEKPAGGMAKEKKNFRNFVRSKFQVAAFSENNLVQTNKNATKAQQQQSRMKSRRAELRIVFHSVKDMEELTRHGVKQANTIDNDLGACKDVWAVFRK